MELKGLHGKITVITGGAQGIGEASAHMLAQEGASVVIADLRYDFAKKVCEEIISQGYQADCYRVDISDPDSILQMKSFVLDKYGRADILVNSAGITSSYNIDTITVDDWDRMLSINLRGTHLCCQAFKDSMRENKFGRIINIASMAGRMGGLKAGPDYSASKAGVICLTKSYARFLAPYVTVNSICPGMILTPMTQERNDDPSIVPLGRIGRADDIAYAVAFFASEMGDYITGATLDVNGGLYMD
ncbi:MAG: 3-oxoacyl-ACP reductase family protein [Eubacteriales bacterium]